MNNFDDCQAYVVQLRVEHERIHDTVRRIEQEWPQVLGSVLPAEKIETVLRELEELRSALAYRFAEEEQGGCLEEAVCRCPKVGSAADSIEHEHTVLLRQLDEVIQRVREGKQPATQVHPQFQAFVNDLYAHDTAESRLLSTAFGLTLE